MYRTQPYKQCIGLRITDLSIGSSHRVRKSTKVVVHLAALVACNLSVSFCLFGLAGLVVRPTRRVVLHLELELKGSFELAGLCSGRLAPATAIDHKGHRSVVQQFDLHLCGKDSGFHVSSAVS
jgi:hypothetical protein